MEPRRLPPVDGRGVAPTQVGPPLAFRLRLPHRGPWGGPGLAGPAQLAIGLVAGRQRRDHRHPVLSAHIARLRRRGVDLRSELVLTALENRGSAPAHLDAVNPEALAGAARVAREDPLDSDGLVREAPQGEALLRPALGAPGPPPIVAALRRHATVEGLERHDARRVLRPEAVAARTTGRQDARGHLLAIGVVAQQPDLHTVPPLRVATSLELAAVEVLGLHVPLGVEPNLQPLRVGQRYQRRLQALQLIRGVLPARRGARPPSLALARQLATVGAQLPQLRPAPRNDELALRVDIHLDDVVLLRPLEGYALTRRELNHRGLRAGRDGHDLRPDEGVRAAVDGDRRVAGRCEAEHSCAAIVDIRSDVRHVEGVCRPEHGEGGAVPVRPFPHGLGHLVLGLLRPGARLQDALRRHRHSVVQQSFGESVLRARGLHRDRQELFRPAGTDVLQEVVEGAAAEWPVRGVECLVVLQCARGAVAK
mmetsp:Transcript_919/g.2402  ORF Transcript_919/g.2402 Transcript_919/m.2402 type:complete len:480 (-) Transcript_919:481-1920(-)